MNIVEPKIEDYIVSLRNEDDTLLAEMEAYAEENDFPIIGPEVGRLLHILTRATGAKTVFEMGSGYGYAGYWIAGALPDDGLIHMTDGSDMLKQMAIGVFRRAGFEHKMNFHLGNALEIIDQTEGPFDIVFNDIDKEYYPETVDRVVPKLRTGGLFITDNTLWYGKVADGSTPDKTTTGVLEFNKRVTNHPQLRTVILPIRDGLTVCVKL